MSRETLRSRIAVVGVGTRAFGALPGYTTADLGLWALHEALADCGLPATAIDGLIVTRIADNAAYAEAAGISPDFSLVMPPLGRMAGIAIETACLALASGRARRIALVYGNDGRSAGMVYGGKGTLLGAYGYDPFWAPSGMTSSPACASCTPKYPPAPPVPKIAMRILKFLHKLAKAVDQRIDAGETEQPAQRHLVEAAAGLPIRLKVLDDGMRSEIEAGGNQPIGLRIPSAERPGSEGSTPLLPIHRPQVVSRITAIDPRSDLPVPPRSLAPAGGTSRG